MICVNDRNVYRSAAEAAAAYGIKNPSSVGRVCSGKRKSKSICGLVFRFVAAPGIDLSTIETVKVGKYWAPAREVVCCNDGKHYDSITIAANAYGVSLSAVSAVLRGRAKTTAGGRSFRYAGDPLAIEALPIETDRAHTRKIVCLDDGLEYRSISEAARAYGLNFRYISANLLGSQNYNIGRTFRYVE